MVVEVVEASGKDRRPAALLRLPVAEHFADPLGAVLRTELNVDIGEQSSGA